MVSRAHEAGVELLALSDHDTVDGLDEAFAAAASTGGELTLVSAVEISSLDRGEDDLHILGYGIDHHNAALLARLGLWREDRLARGERIATAMRELGWEVALPARGDKPLGRPHIAAAIFDHPANAQRVGDEGLKDSTQLLVAYLIPGAAGYRGRSAPTVAEAIEAIHDAGGLAVWAHPYWDFQVDFLPTPKGGGFLLGFRPYWRVPAWWFAVHRPGLLHRRLPALSRPVRPRKCVLRWCVCPPNNPIGQRGVSEPIPPHGESRRFPRGFDEHQHEATRDLLERFAALGGDGVEAFYITHSEDQTRRLVELAGGLDLLTTGSADFHGESNPNFSAFRAFSLYGLQPRLGPIDVR